MRTSSFWAALTVSLLAVGSLTADDKAVPRHLQFNVRVCEGDPLGSVKVGTQKLHCDTRLVTLENRSATIVSGGELPVMRDGKTIENVQYGRTVELRPGKVQDGKVHLDIELIRTAIVSNTEEQIELRSESARTLKMVKFGETVKLRWPGGSAENQAWVEFSVEAIERPSR